MKVYCDNGATTPKLRKLKKEGIVELFMFQYENKNRHTKSGKPSEAKFADLKNYTFADLRNFTYNDFTKSEKHQLIVKAIGLENKRIDILHLDAAYKTGCGAFITNDIDDILRYRETLENILGYRIFHVSEMCQLEKYIASVNK